VAFVSDLYVILPLESEPLRNDLVHACTLSYQIKYNILQINPCTRNTKSGQPNMGLNILELHKCAFYLFTYFLAYLFDF
jgi:hypothetical protein